MAGVVAEAATDPMSQVSLSSDAVTPLVRTSEVEGLKSSSQQIPSSSIIKSSSPQVFKSLIIKSKSHQIFETFNVNGS